MCMICVLCVYVRAYIRALELVCSCNNLRTRTIGFLHTFRFCHLQPTTPVCDHSQVCSRQWVINYKFSPDICVKYSPVSTKTVLVAGSGVLTTTGTE